MTSWMLPLLLLMPSAKFETGRADDMAQLRRWVAGRIAPADERARPTPPFSFVYDGRPSAELLPAWEFERGTRQLDAARTEHTATYRDPQSGLAVRSVAVVYRDFPTVEWTVHFENAGRADTPVLTDVYALDATWPQPSQGACVLHHHVGSPCTPADYGPLETPLKPGVEKRISAAGGRPTNSDLSYFNLEWAGGGMIFVVGWPGQWSTRFIRDADRNLTIQAGQEQLRVKLHPGEQIRTPLVVLQFWQGDRIRAHNVWRRWMTAHHVPRPGGKPFTTHYASTSGDISDAAREIRLLEDCVQRGIKLDYWIMDANWYPTGGKWFHTGTWTPDPLRFPRGLGEVNDAAHARGMKTVVWFEPERVWPGTWLWQQHPEWLLGCPTESEQTPELGRAPNRLLNLGNPTARKWLVDHVDRMITQQKIDVYRQDFNINPLAYWRANDPPDRQGMTEHNYVTGYLAWWDELLRRHPEIWIDTCASGGRRNDLETLRRAVPLLRSDFFGTAEAQQCQTLGISLWMPFHGTGCGPVDDYLIRSSMCPLFRIGVGRPMTDAEAVRIGRHAEQFRRIAPCWTGDFYPLTPYNLTKAVWAAWQFDRPELGQGMIQAFRRGECPTDTIHLKLGGLEPDAKYAVTNLDEPGTSVASGADLMNAGLKVSASSRPQAFIFAYQRQP